MFSLKKKKKIWTNLPPSLLAICLFFLFLCVYSSNLNTVDVREANIKEAGLYPR